MFIDLDSTRTSNGFGINPIQYSEMLAYFKLFHIEPEDYEITAIRLLDNVAREHFNKKMKEDKKK